MPSTLCLRLYREVVKDMTGYIIRRLLHALLVVVLMSMLIFVLIRLLPGDPIELLYGERELVVLTPEALDEIRARYGLDRPLPIQYLSWAGNLLRGDFGRSLIRGFDIADQLGSRVTVTVLIGLSSLVLGLIIGPLLGLISAIKQGTWIDNVVSTFANIGITAPQFWVAIIMIYIFGLRLRVLPQWGFVLPWEDFWQFIRHSIMPVFVGALGIIASTARQMRSSALETLGEDHIRTAWAKGLREKKVILKHVIKNSFMPILTLGGVMFRMVVGGSVVIETIFVIPGMGSMMVDGMASRDYPVVQAIALVMTLVVVLANLVVDLLYVWLDPRISYS